MISVNFFSKYLLLHQNAEVTKLYTIHAAWLDPIVLYRSYLSFYVPLYSVGASYVDWKCDTIFFKYFEMNDGDVCSKPAILPWRQLHQYSTSFLKINIFLFVTQVQIWIIHLPVNFNFFSYTISTSMSNYIPWNLFDTIIYPCPFRDKLYQFGWKNQWVI